MTHNPNRVPHATNFLSVAATSSNLRSERVRQSTASIPAKRGVHTSLIDAEWDLLADTGTAHQSGDHQVHARAPHTSLIDTEWDLQSGIPDAPQSSDHRIHARAAQTTLVDTEWDQETPVVADESKPAGVSAQSPRASLIDGELDSQLEARAGDPPEAPRVFILPRQITLLDMADMEEDPDPVITYFELDGPECLFDDFDPAQPYENDLVFPALAR